MATKINPAVDDVFCQREQPYTFLWEVVRFVDSDMVVTRRFNGAEHRYTRNDWHAFDWVKIEVPASPPVDAVAESLLWCFWVDIVSSERNHRPLKLREGLRDNLREYLVKAGLIPLPAVKEQA